jgi:hypothetical protein
VGRGWRCDQWAHSSTLVPVARNDDSGEMPLYRDREAVVLRTHKLE